MTATRIYGKNAAYQKFEVLKTNRVKRYRYGEFFVEGVRNINQAVKNGWSFSSLLYTDEQPLSRWAQGCLKDIKTEVNYILPAALMRELSGKEDASELLAVIKMRPDAPGSLALSDCPLLALFDRPSNRGNLGTMIRSLDALGADALIVTGHAVDVYDPEVVSSGMGSFFNLPVVRMHDQKDIDALIADLRARYPGFQALATTAHRQSPLDEADLTAPCLLMIGNETDGLCKALYAAADQTITIPMAETSSASSFNVACAATVILYEITRQRRAKARG